MSNIAQSSRTVAGSGGTVDTAARTSASQAKAKADAISPDAGSTVTGPTTILSAGKIWSVAVGTHTMPNPVTEAALDADAAFSEQEATQIDETVLSTVDLAGAAPAGAKEGRNTTNGKEFYVSGGVWVAEPDVGSWRWSDPITADRTITAADLVGGVYAATIDATAGDVTITLADDIPVGSDFAWRKIDDTTNVAIAIASIPVSGQPVIEGAWLEAPGMAHVRKAATEWISMMKPSVSGVTTPADTVARPTSIASGGKWISTTDGLEWLNTTNASLNLPTDDTSANMLAAGFSDARDFI